MSLIPPSAPGAAQKEFKPRLALATVVVGLAFVVLLGRLFQPALRFRQPARTRYPSRAFRTRLAASPHPALVIARETVPPIPILVEQRMVTAYDPGLFKFGYAAVYLGAGHIQHPGDRVSRFERVRLQYFQQFIHSSPRVRGRT